MFWAPMLMMGAMSSGKAFLDNKAAMKQTKVRNKAAAKTDLRNLADAAEQVGSLGMMAAQYRDAATKARTDAAREVGKARGTAEAQAGATGIKGASVDAVIDDLDRELGEAQVQIDRNLEAQQYNLGEQIRTLQHATVNGLLGQVDPRAGTRNPLLDGALSVGSMYATSYFQYGARGG